MMTIFDIEATLYRLLNAQTDANGGVYPSDERPADSDKEDICINTISLEADALPLIGTSNVNVYVPDKDVKVDGKPMRMPNKQRLDALANQVIAILRTSRIEGCKATPTNVTLLADTNAAQHYANIRVNWNINI